jgi:hypothetical protein
MTRRFVPLATCVATFTISAIVAAETVKIDFDTDAIGTPPKQFSFALTGQGKPGAWIVKKDDPTHGNVLAQTAADPTDYRFPLAIYDGITATNVDLAVEFKTIAGKVDQGAGLVWRYRDQNNYYLTRCNALEDNCTIYRVIDGHRRAFLNHNVKVTSNAWHTLRLQATGDHFVVTYDGNQVLDAKDDTFKDAGRIGVWTKADSVIYFDNLSVTVAH